MIRYETLLVTVPDLTKDQADTIQKTLEKAVKDAKGTVLSYERWGKYLLAYPIKKNDYGVYFLMRFEVAEEQADALAAKFKQIFTVTLHETVVRDMTAKLDENDSLEYRRPDSLEDAPRTPRGRHDRGSDRRDRDAAPEAKEKKESLEKAVEEVKEQTTKSEEQVSAEVVQEEKVKEEDTQE